MTLDPSVRILVVDDDIDVQTGTARLLKNAGYTVDRASSGEEALEAIQRHRPDMLLLDHEMPGLNGTEVCGRIKQDPALADILVMMVSASHAESAHQAEGLESGADGYVGRPITNRELLARMGAYVRILLLSRSLRTYSEQLKSSMEDAVEARELVEVANRHLKAEIAARNRTAVQLKKRNEELARLNDELVAKAAALAAADTTINALSGIIPICGSCKKVRDDQGYWEQVEAFVSRYSDAQFSHGICPDCMTKLYPARHK